VPEGGCDVPAEGVSGEGHGYPHEDRCRRDAGNRSPEHGVEEPADPFPEEEAQREDVDAEAMEVAKARPLCFMGNMRATLAYGVDDEGHHGNPDGVFVSCRA